MYDYFFFSLSLFLFDMTAGTWQFHYSQLAPPSDSPNKPLSQQSPVLSVVSFSEICLDTTPTSSLIALFTAHRGLELGKGRPDLVDVKLIHPWAPIVGAPHKSSKASESGTNAPSSLHYPIIQIQQPITPSQPQS